MSKLETPLTQEQQNWVCEVIGNWYLDWKDRMTEDHAPHRLGYAKEILKEMICEPEKVLTLKQEIIRTLVFHDEKAIKE